MAAPALHPEASCDFFQAAAGFKENSAFMYVKNFKTNI